MGFCFVWVCWEVDGLNGLCVCGFLGFGCRVILFLGLSWFVLFDGGVLGTKLVWFRSDGLLVLTSGWVVLVIGLVVGYRILFA